MAGHAYVGRGLTVKVDPQTLTWYTPCFLALPRTNPLATFHRHPHPHARALCSLLQFTGTPTYARREWFGQPCRDRDHGLPPSSEATGSVGAPERHRTSKPGRRVGCLRVHICTPPTFRPPATPRTTQHVPQSTPPTRPAPVRSHCHGRCGAARLLVVTGRGRSGVCRPLSSSPSVLPFVLPLAGSGGSVETEYLSCSTPTQDVELFCSFLFSFSLGTG